jgi:hypothetical protein
MDYWIARHLFLMPDAVLNCKDILPLPCYSTSLDQSARVLDKLGGDDGFELELINRLNRMDSHWDQRPSYISRYLSPYEICLAAFFILTNGD